MWLPMCLCDAPGVNSGKASATNTAARCPQKVSKKIEDEQSEMLAAFTVKIYAALDDLTDAISAALKKKSDGISGADALAYARALLTIKNTLAIDNPLDAEEKHWRIEKLRRESERDTQQQNQTFIVRMEDGIEEWAK